ncbi:phosphatidylserine decarboxylase family protein [Succinispira mobilis]|uniref:phosphatidylserine decarboxylase family protein n=1 Tax=Succinispira mobilis TaxID=78120 RepID=UPI00036AA54B|nr:phosphatidylserine decarboxylase family protein [Succinispira mobilis]
MVKAPIVKDGHFIIAFFLVLTTITAIFGDIYWSIIPGVLVLFFMFFFRNPNRKVILDDKLLLSPADGMVMGVEDIYDEEFLQEPATKVTIFLSVFDVHINRSPMRGEIKYQRYTCGGFRPAYKKSASFENERHAIGIDNGKIKILVIQVAGLLARRIVSWVTLGHNIEQGQRYGMIKFGSSTELILPKNVTVLVKKGKRVIGGKTVIGRID